MIKFRTIILGCIFLALVSGVSAEGLLKPTCIHTLTSDFVGPMTVGDINSDGTPDVVVGTRVNGIVNSFKYKSYDCANDWGAVQSGGWSLSTGGDIQSMFFGEVYGGKRIVVNGIESTYNKASKVSKYALVITPLGAEDWNFKEACGVSYSVYAADVDNTGVNNVILGTKSGKVCVLKDNVKTREPVLWTYSTDRPVYVVKAADLDGDGKTEVLALDRQLFNSALYCLGSDGTLKWKYVIEGGIYIASLAEKMISVSDLDGDGKKEVIVGSYKRGVDVIDSSGKLKWNYQTKSASSNDLVSVVRAADLDGDGKLEVIAAAKPYIYALDSSGSLIWKASVNTMVYGLAVGDVFGGSEPEVLASATRYVHVFSNHGTIIDSWAYKVEIQGTDVLFQEKDANGYNIAVADLDGDGKNEVATSFGWQEDRDIVTYYYGDVRVFEVDENFKSVITTSTMPAGGSHEYDEETATTIRHVTETTLSSELENMAERKGGFCCLPMLPAVLALALALLGYPVR